MNFRKKINYLFIAKNNGFKRTGPQSQSEKKSEEKSNFMCDQCGCELQSLGLLTAHIASHTELLQFECDFCDDVFENIHTLQDHIKQTKRISVTFVVKTLKTKNSLESI